MNIDTLSPDARTMLAFILHIDIIGHQHAEEINKKLQKEDPSKYKKLMEKLDWQTWELPNKGIEELLDKNFISFDKKYNRGTKIKFRLSNSLQRAKNELYTTLKSELKHGINMCQETTLGSISTLKTLLKAPSTNDNDIRSGRILQTIRCKYCSDWYMHVPDCFNAALDIQLMERKKNTVSFLAWTQGSNFGFAKGDIIYKNSYTGSSISPLIQIDAASPVSVQDGERLPGYVKFSWHFTENNTSHNMTQDNFVHFLVNGPQKKLQKTLKSRRDFSDKLLRKDYQLTLFS